MPPVQPMLAKSVKGIPDPAKFDGLIFEPKWDGFRCIVFRDGDEVELTSRNTKPLTRYFPELVEAIKEQLPERCVLDGEVFVAVGDKLEFEVLQERIHPAKSRVDMLSEKTPAGFVAFDLLALGDESYVDRPLSERRAALEEALGHLDGSGPCYLTRTTTDPAEAERWFEQFEGAGLDGVVAKPLGTPYTQNGRVMLKIKHSRTADVVLAGYREHKNSTPERPLLGSLLLGLFNDDGQLQHVGVSASFTEVRRAELIEELQPLVCPIEEHPWGHWQEFLTANPDRVPGTQSRWSQGKDLSFTPAAAGAGARGRLRAHGGAAVPPHRALQAVARGPRPRVLRLRAARGAGELRPRRSPEWIESRSSVSEPVSEPASESTPYNVVLLVEENLTAADAARVHSLHEGIDGPVVYHVLMPMVDGSARIQAAMGGLGAPDLVPSPTFVLEDIDPAEILEEAKQESDDALATAVRVLQATGSAASGRAADRRPDRRARRQGRRGRRPRGDHLHRGALRRRAPPDGLDLAGPPPHRRAHPPPHGAGDVRRAGRRRRGRHGAVRLSPRRRTDGDDAPPRGPVAAYAGILDGRHLWLTLESGDGAVLRDGATGTTFELGDVTDLLALLPAGDAAYDVVQGGKGVWGPPPPTGDPTRVPVSPDGLAQLGLERTEAGHLRVTRRAVAPTALLEAIELRDGEAHLTLAPPGDVEPGTHLLLLDGTDQLLDQLPVTAHDGHVEALVGVADLPAGYFGVVRLALGTEDSWVRIRRRRSDLADPHRAVLLPELHDDRPTEADTDEDAPRARFRWNPDSHLVLRVLDPAEQAGPGATVTPMASRT